MSTIILPATQELLNGFAAVALHAAGRTDLNLHRVRVTRWTIAATQRYSAAIYEHTTFDESVARYGETGPSDPDTQIHLPVAIAVEISKQKLDRAGESLLILGGDTATLTHKPADDEPAQTLWQRSWIETSTATYPPVERLFPDQSDLVVDYLPIHLGSDILELVAKSGKALAKGMKQGPAALRFQHDSPQRTGKARPVLVTAGRLSMIVQPVIPTGGVR